VGAAPRRRRLDIARRKREMTASRRPLRVLLILESLPFGNDHRVKKQVRSLLEEGHSVTVICRRSSRNDPYRNTPNLRLLEHPAPPELPGKLGFFVEYSVSWVMAAAMTVLAFARYRFDVIQACCPPDIYFPLAIPFKALGRKFVVDQRDLSPEVYADRFGARESGLLSILRKLERMSYRSADHVISVNESLREVIKERGDKRDDQVSVVGNGPVLAALPPRPSRDVTKKDSLLCCWLGVMGPQDHVDLVLYAAEELVHRRSRGDCHFVLAGAGESLEDLRRMCTALNLDEWVTFTGWLEDEMVIDLLSKVDVGVDTNLQAEVTPVKGMEYMALRVPFVAFDLLETRRMAEDAALYAPPGDTGALADRIAELLDDPARREQMGATGRARVETELSWESQRDRYLAVYQGLR
jgi:glycosyltransferase involved in cell wall biosynthesis